MKSILTITAAAVLALTAASMVRASGRTPGHPDQMKHDEAQRQESSERTERRDEDAGRHEHRFVGLRYRVEQQLLTIDGHGNWALVGEYETRAEAEAAAAPLRETENVRIRTVLSVHIK